MANIDVALVLLKMMNRNLLVLENLLPQKISVLQILFCVFLRMVKEMVVAKIADGSIATIATNNSVPNNAGKGSTVFV